MVDIDWGRVIRDWWRSWDRAYAPRPPVSTTLLDDLLAERMRYWPLRFAQPIGETPVIRKERSMPYHGDDPDNEKFWIVWNPTAGIPRVFHENRGDAVRESERLALANPGGRFYVLAATGLSHVPLPQPAPVFRDLPTRGTERTSRG